MPRLGLRPVNAAPARSRARSRAWRATLSWLGLLGVLPGCSLFERDDVLVLTRRGDAGSRATAERYVARHRIAAERILELPLSIAPASDVIDAGRYRDEIEDAITRHLTLHDRGGDVRTIVTTPGLPWRVADCGRGDGAPCRETSLQARLASLGVASEPAAAPRANPFFAEARRFGDFRRDRPEAAARFPRRPTAGSRPRSKPRPRCLGTTQTEESRPPRPRAKQRPTTDHRAGRSWRRAALDRPLRPCSSSHSNHGSRGWASRAAARAAERHGRSTGS